MIAINILIHTKPGNDMPSVEAHCTVPGPNQFTTDEADLSLRIRDAMMKAVDEYRPGGTHNVIEFDLKPRP